jgi:hypothetical protein
LLAYDGQLDSIEEEFLDGTVPNETASPSAPGADAPAVDDAARASGAAGGAASAPPSSAGKAGLEGGIPELPPF